MTVSFPLWFAVSYFLVSLLFPVALWIYWKGVKEDRIEQDMLSKAANAGRVGAYLLCRDEAEKRRYQILSGASPEDQIDQLLLFIKTQIVCLEDKRRRGKG
jgi:hypothetical protein